MVSAISLTERPRGEQAQYFELPCRQFIRALLLEAASRSASLRAMSALRYFLPSATVCTASTSTSGALALVR